MTITPKYIAMCAAAEEIQAMRAPRLSNFSKQSVDAMDYEMGDWLTWWNNRLGKMDIFLWGSLCDITDDDGRRPDKIAWLPRLDQLLEIAGDIEMSIKEASAVFKTNREEEFLVVVMRNKYGKKWNGESWVSK